MSRFTIVIAKKYGLAMKYYTHCLLFLLALSGSAGAADLLNSGTTQPSMTLPYANIGESCPGNGAAALTTTGKALMCESGRWSTSTFNGHYYYQSLVRKTYTGVNDRPGPIFVNAFGGNAHTGDPTNPCFKQACGNSCSLIAASNGVGVAHHADNATNGARTCVVGFWVAPGTIFTIVSEPYSNPYGGDFYITLFGE